jgi:hypothetical protein
MNAARRRVGIGGLVIAAIALPPAAFAASLDQAGEIKLGVRTYVNARIGTEATDGRFDYLRAANGTIARNSDGFPIIAERTQTFPYSPAGHLRQNRFFAEVELKHDLDRLLKQGFGPLGLLNLLPFRVRNLGYGVTYRGEYDGIYDWGPSEYRNAWGPGYFFTSEGNNLPVNPIPGPNPPCRVNPTDARCRRIVDIGNARSELRDNASHRSRLFQAYIHADLGPSLWFRFGRQIVAWGETDNFRLLDNINPTDSSFGGFLVPLDERRVPLDMLRMTYHIGDLGPLWETFLEAYASIDDAVGWDPGTPQGSPWTFPNLGEPSPLSQTIRTPPSRTFGDMRGGARLVFNVWDATCSLAHYYTYLDLPAVEVRFNQGFPLQTFPDGYSTRFFQTAPRTQISGASTTFPVPLDWARFLRLSGQPIIRSEFAYFMNEPRYRQSEIDPFVVYRSPGRPTEGARRRGDSVNFVLGIDLNQFIQALNPRQSFFISTQFFYKHLVNPAESGQVKFGNFSVEDGEVLPVPGLFVQPEGLNQFYATEPVFVRQPTDQFLQTLLISTAYYSSQVNPQLLIFYDWGGALLFQPGVTFLHDPFRFSIDYTIIHANTLKGGSGVSLLRDRDNIQFRFEYVL